MPVRELWTVYIALEGVYGEGASFSGTDAIEVFDFDFKPSHTILEKAPNPTSLNDVSDIIEGKRWVEVSFKTYLKGSGMNGAPRIGRLLSSAGFLLMMGTGGGSNYASYTPQNDTSSIALLAQTDSGYCVKLKGGVVKRVSVTGTVGDFLIAQFNIVGIFDSESTTPESLTPSFEASLPLVVKGGTLSGKLSNTYWKNFEVSIENTHYEQLNASDTYGIKRFYIVQRKIRGSFDPELSSDFIKYPGESLGNISISLSNGEDNIVEISAPKVKIAEAREINVDNRILRFSIPLIFLPNTGNDEIKFKFEWTKV